MSSAAVPSSTPVKTKHFNVAVLEHENLAHFGTYTRRRYEDRSFTNLEELQYSGRIARVLKERGVRAGNRVFAVLPNSPELTAFFQAAWTIGAVAVPIAAQWSVPEIAYALSGATPSALLTVPTLAPRLREACASAGIATRLLCCGETDVSGAENILPECSDKRGQWISEPTNRLGSDPAMLLYTSGTMAKPKAVIVTNENIPAAMEAVHRVNPSLPRRTILHVLPLHHVFGILMLQLSNR